MPKNIKAIAVLNSPQCKGTINIIELEKGVRFDVNLKNLTPGLHGFHIHEAGNLEDGCKSCCAHFNPLNNIVADKNGNCVQSINDIYLQLRGYKYNIIGRSIVVHEKEDDLGRGGNAESKKTGNAGARIGCGVIGYKEGYYF